jgi:hypothetical protein
MLDEVSERARQLEALLKQATQIQVSKKSAEMANADETVRAAPDAAIGGGVEGIPE